MKWIAVKLNDDGIKGNIAFYCKMPHVRRQDFYKYLMNQERPWNYQPLADAMLEIQVEEECNNTYRRIRMYQALILKQPENCSFPK